MVHENPLLTLGVPKVALVRECTSGTPEGVLTLAEANYRTLSKRYHPDLVSGDATLMASFSDAISELHDPDALEFYINEIVGEEDLKIQGRKKEATKLVVRDNDALVALANGCIYIDQFRVLDITRATSYIADLGGKRIIVDVLSPSKAIAHIVDSRYGVPADLGGDDIKVKYQKGAWKEIYYDGVRRHWESYETFMSSDDVTLVGFTAASSCSDGIAFGEASSSAIARVDRAVRLNWEYPRDCWFLPTLVVGAPTVGVNKLVLYSQGKFATTGALLGRAAKN